MIRGIFDFVTTKDIVIFDILLLKCSNYIYIVIVFKNRFVVTTGVVLICRNNFVAYREKSDDKRHDNLLIFHNLCHKMIEEGTIQHIRLKNWCFFGE